MKRPRYSRDRIKAVLTAVALPAGYRLVPARYLNSPLGTAPTNSRFCAKTAGFTVLYAASDFASSFLETAVRDQFTRKQRRKVDYEEIAKRAWTRIASKPGTALRLLDLRRDGCLSVGAPTDTVKARNQTAGRAFAKAVYAGHPDIDGFLYESRLNGADIYAVFDRGIGKLHATDSGMLEDHPELLNVLERYGIDLDLGDE